jgi:ABC-2 type transport system ATP-binding protein
VWNCVNCSKPARIARQKHRFSAAPNRAQAVRCLRVFYDGFMSLAIRVSNLVKTYPASPPVEAVRGVDLVVNVGECFGLLGPNGAGKTTTLEIIEGLLEPTSGEVEVLGRTWERDDQEIRERIGITLQETRLSDKLNVRETVTLFRSFYRNGITPDEAIEQVSLQEKARAFVDKLSGGQKQRLAIACGLVGDPELLFLDEPTTGLDPQSRRQLWDVIRRFKARQRTVLLTTHYMDEAEKLCDRVAIVDHGKVIALGTPNELILQLGGEHVIELTLSEQTPLAEADLSQVRSVRSVRMAPGGVYTLSVAEPSLALPAVMELVRAKNAELVGLTTRHATLEDVFVNLTGRQLRDTA